MREGYMEKCLYDRFGLWSFRASPLFFQDNEQSLLCRQIAAYTCSIVWHLKIRPSKLGLVGMKVWPVGIRNRNEWVICHFLKTRRNVSPANGCTVSVSAISMQQATPKQMIDLAYNLWGRKWVWDQLSGSSAGRWARISHTCVFGSCQRGGSDSKYLWDYLAGTKVVIGSHLSDHPRQPARTSSCGSKSSKRGIPNVLALFNFLFISCLLLIN